LKDPTRRYPLVDGVHVVVYDTHDAGDLRRKLRYYLARPEAAAKIAANGLAHVLRHHRAVSRVDYILRTLAEKWRRHPEGPGGAARAGAAFSETGFDIRASRAHELHAAPFPYSG